MASNFDFRIGQTLGFLGVGTMNSAIIEGILKLHLSENKLQHFPGMYSSSQNSISKHKFLCSENIGEKIYLDAQE